jgi:hypothetical protein
MQNEEEPFFIKCPHCDDFIYIEKLNCRIFRHAVYKKNNEQIDPHTPKNICEKLINNNEIYGCGKPFKINTINNIHNAVICDYI